MSKQLVVIGGGAAGFFCAVNAARLNKDLHVILVEKTSKLLSKVRVSGGGRCNVTHACFDINEMSRRYPRGEQFVKRAFHQFFTNDTIAWFEERSVSLKTEADGRMFPTSDSSQTIIDCLVKEANKYKVEILLSAEVQSIARLNDLFAVKLSGNRDLAAEFVCVGCGGYPKVESFGWLKETGHDIVEPVPSLFSFNFPSHSLVKLMGITVEGTRIKIDGSSWVEEGPTLITHWGLSGPVVLRLSAIAARDLAAKKYQFTIRVNWIHGTGIKEAQVRELLATARTSIGSQTVTSYNFAHLPQRLWAFLLAESGITKGMRLGDLSKKSENAMITHLMDYPIAVNGKTTFKEEFVTAGGISLNDVDPRSMMSRKIPRLFFAGEILDVDAITGGYNFQHAWTSGHIAAAHISKLCDLDQLNA